MQILHTIFSYPKIRCLCLVFSIWALGNAGASESLASDTTLHNYFSLDRIIAVDIEIAEKDWEELRHQSRSLFDILAGDCLANPAPDVFSWFTANVSVDGETFENVGIRKKGFLGSLNEDKPALKIRFDKYVEGQLLDEDMPRLTLNNSIQDPSMINTCMAYRIFSDAGIPAPRCNFSTVSINGRRLGLYVNVESVKENFIRRNFSDPNGSLYEGTLSDFRIGWKGTFERQINNESADFSDIREVVEKLQNSDSTDLVGLKEVVDLDQFLSFWTIEVMIGHWDGYAGNRNNYFVYREPGRPFVFIPWGVDQVFETIDSPFDSFVSPPSVAAHGIISHRLYQNENMRAEYFNRMNRLLDTVWNEELLVARADSMSAIVQSFALPHERTAAKRDAYRVYHFIRNRRNEIMASIDPNPPNWPWKLEPPTICWPQVGTFDISFSTFWGSNDQGDLEKSRGSSQEGVVVETEDFRIGEKSLNRSNLTATAGESEEDSRRATIEIGATHKDGRDVLWVSLPTEKVKTNSLVEFNNSEEIESYHISIPFSKKDEGAVNIVGRGFMNFVNASTETGAPISGKMVGDIFSFDNKAKPFEDAYLTVPVEDEIGKMNLLINEVAARGEPLDWFEVYNDSSEPIDLNELLVADDLFDENERVSFPENMIIEPGEYLIIELDKKGWPGFALGGDEELGIWNKDGILVASVDWEDGDSGDGESFARLPDLRGGFETSNMPTPGTPNVKSMPNTDLPQVVDVGLVINEIASKGEPFDWFELYNSGEYRIDLSLFSLADDLSDESKRVSFPQGMVIDPRQYLKIELDKKGWARLALGKDEELGIWDADGVLVASVDWEDGASGEGESFARLPDIDGDFKTVKEPTPGKANQINTAVLALDQVLPNMFSLKGNWPNPFNGETIIGFDLAKDGKVYLEVFDSLGRKVAVLNRGDRLSRGSHFSVWDGRDLEGRSVATGAYFYQLRIGMDYEAEGRMMLLR